MIDRLRQAIKQVKSFRSPQQEAFLNLLRTADAFLRAEEKVLKPWGLSFAQYNVLRILRGSHPAGMSCGELSSRLITWNPDLTRLLDKLVSRLWAVRDRETRDRRVVTVRITESGLELVRRLDQPVLMAHRSLMKHMSADDLRSLTQLLEKLRKNLD